MEGITKEKKIPLDLDWDKLLPRQEDDDDEAPPPVVVVVDTTASMSQNQLSTMNAESQRETFYGLSDFELDELIKRQKNTLQSMGQRLPDKGEKFKVTIKRCEEEKQRRKLQRVEKENGVCEKPTRSNSSNVKGTRESFKQPEGSFSEAQTQSIFASQFSKRMEENNCRTDNAFDKEMSYFGRCDRRKTELNGQSSTKGKHNSKKSNFHFTRNLSLDKDQHVLSNGVQNVKSSSTCSLREYSKCLSSKKRSISEILSSKDATEEKRETVVVLDEEEVPDTEATQEAEKLVESMKDATIYYPSRDDPESVEISFSDMECLTPEAFLTSTIMNFYIRYLQQLASIMVRERCDYHFFNTYFYKKLIEAVSYKGSDKEFIKLRRWWKGVNIFQKPYVFIPIHENLHWSLVIICIPSKEDESGPIILHLDSLGFHDSRIIFQNINRYVIEEWKHLNQEIAPPNVDIAETIWQHLPRTIEEKSIKVPQQKNDSDCGLFVLYFMKRFIEEAPDRLQKKDLAMFGRQWFKPEDASGLRKIIREILLKEFLNAKGR